MIIEIVAHPANDNLRKNNQTRLANRQDAQPLITDQMLILCDGKSVGWMNNHPLCKPGVAMTMVVDDETLEEIDREVERYLGESVQIGEAEPDEEEDEKPKKRRKRKPEETDPDES